MYDIIVVGGGPAGLTAALYALRADKSVLIIEKDTFGGQITHSPKVENYPGFAEMSGNEFADKLLDQVLGQGAEIELSRVTSVEDKGDFKVVTSEDGVYEAKAVIIAVGVKHRMLGAPGEGELVGHGISFCAVCDGAFYKGRDVAVIGGGNSALQEALLLAKTSKSVTVVQNLDYLTGEARLQKALEAQENVKVILGSVVKEFKSEDGKLSSVVITGAKGERELAVDGVFVAIGLIPENKPFENLAALNGCGYFDTDESCVTKTPGVFVAGDCRSKRIRQITTASADGAVAALAACDYIDN